MGFFEYPRELLIRSVHRSLAHAAYKRGDMVLILTWKGNRRGAVLVPTKMRNVVASLQRIGYSNLHRINDDAFMKRACELAAEQIDMQGQEARIERFLRDHLHEMEDMSLIAPKAAGGDMMPRGELHCWAVLCTVEEGEDFANDAGA